MRVLLFSQYSRVTILVPLLIDSGPQGRLCLWWLFQALKAAEQLRTGPGSTSPVCVVAASVSHVLPEVKSFSCPICLLQGLVFLWSSSYLVVLQSQPSDGHKKCFGFVDYLAFSHF